MVKRFITYSLAVATAGTFFALFASVLPMNQAHALSGSEFQPGRIIDDSVFYNPNTMTIPQIQEFLRAKVPVCDTWGTQMRGSITRAQHGTNNGVPPPYTCLKDFRQDTTAKPAEAGLCNGYGAVNHSAADIIYHVAQSCGINPKVLLVLLQKEQSLITDDWPWPIQYRAATGYGCPDTAACDSQYYGFFNQVYAAARGYKYYAKHATSFNYLAGRNNFIQYNPNAGCGGSSIFIQNQATAGLYNYTPYQPNAAALNNLYGTGDGCSAYGNRNFWRLFNDWFGSTTDNIPISYNLRYTSPISITPANPVAGEPVTISYTIKNTDPNNPATMESRIIQCRLLPGTICGANYEAALTLAPNEERTFTTTLTSLQTGGTYSLTPYFLQNGVWYRFGSDSAGGNTAQLYIPGMRLISPVSISPANPSAGDTVTVTYRVKNMGITPVPYNTSVLQCIYNTTTSCDPQMHNPFTVAPNEERTFTVTIPSLQPGSYALTPYYYHNGMWRKYGTWGVASNTMSLALPDVRLVGNITSSPTQPISGQPTTFTYTVQNFGSSTVAYDKSILQCRFATFTNCDPSFDAPTSLAAGEQRTFNVTIPLVRAGSYTLTPYFMTNGQWYRYGKGTASSNAAQLSASLYTADMRLVGEPTYTPSDPIPGQNVTVNYTVQNHGSQTAYYQTSVLQCRHNNINCDPPHDQPVTIAPGAQHTFTAIIPSVKAGTYTLTPYFAQNYTYYNYAKGTASDTRFQLTIPPYIADMRMVGPITLSPEQPIPGQPLTVTYTVRNHGTKPAIFQNSILQCRRFTFINCDPPFDPPATINAGDQKTFTVTFPSLPSGYYIFTPYFKQNDVWHRYHNGTATRSNLEVTF